MVSSHENYMLLFAPARKQPGASGSTAGPCSRTPAKPPPPWWGSAAAERWNKGLSLLCSCCCTSSSCCSLSIPLQGHASALPWDERWPWMASLLLSPSCNLDCIRTTGWGPRVYTHCSPKLGFCLLQLLSAWGRACYSWRGCSLFSSCFRGCWMLVWENPRNQLSSILLHWVWARHWGFITGLFPCKQKFMEIIKLHHEVAKQMKTFCWHGGDTSVCTWAWLVIVEKKTVKHASLLLWYAGASL